MLQELELRLNINTCYSILHGQNIVDVHPSRSLHLFRAIMSQAASPCAISSRSMNRAAGEGKRIIHNLLKHLTGVHALPLACTSNLSLARTSLQARLQSEHSQSNLREAMLVLHSGLKRQGAVHDLALFNK